MRTSVKQLDDSLQAAIAVGEAPYQANRAAVHSLDILNRAGEGRAKLIEVLSGLDDFIRALERVRDAAENVNRDAVAALH